VWCTNPTVGCRLSRGPQTYSTEPPSFERFPMEAQSISPTLCSPGDSQEPPWEKFDPQKSPPDKEPPWGEDAPGAQLQPVILLGPVCHPPKHITCRVPLSENPAFGPIRKLSKLLRGLRCKNVSRGT